MAFDVSSFPYDTVVFINTVIDGIHYRSSGVMISNDEVLTASHVVFNASSGHAASSVTVYPAYNNGPNPAFGSANAKWFHYYGVGDADGAISLPESQNDYAVIHLSQKLNTGYMGLLSNFSAGTVHVTGFPASAGYTMIDSTQYVVKDSRYALLDGSTIGKGSSGGPVWVSQSDGPFVVGVVSSGDAFGNGYFTQLSTNTFNQVIAWRNFDDYTKPLVDSAFYSSVYVDVTKAAMTEAYHYDNFGWHEGRDPNRFFSTIGYLAVNRDIKNAGVNPLDHFHNSGWHEGRDPNVKFDTQLYLQHNPDVARAGIDPLLHYLASGQAEGRQVYTAIGQRNSINGGFDADYYVLANLDVARSGIDPLSHFNNQGWKEGRNPNAFFDTKGYVSNYKDVAAAKLNPLQHYDTYGWKENRDPSTQFDTKNYLSHYGDVSNLRADPLQHFLQFGIIEGRAAFGDGVWH